MVVIEQRQCSPTVTASGETPGHGPVNPSCWNRDVQKSLYPLTSDLTGPLVPTRRVDGVGVHCDEARTHAGETVAVKIQQRPVARFLWIDLATIELYYSLLSYLIPGLRFAWLARETRRHMSDELDFREEARNADKAREMLSPEFAAHELQIPRVHAPLSSARVLTQEWCDGVRVDDKAGLKAIGADARAIAARIQRVFGRMIFVHGFVHCDPHPGNILVGKDGRVILIDHGVYRTLADDVRLTWCQLWLGLIRNDMGEMRAATAALGVDPELTKFFSLVLALVPAKVVEDVHGTSTSSVVRGGGGSGGGGGGAAFIDTGDGRDVGGVVGAVGGGTARGADKSDAQSAGGGGGVRGFKGGLDKLTTLGKREVLKDVMGVKLEDQTRLFETMPRDLLMILKANNLLRYVNEQLGSPVNRFRCQCLNYYWPFTLIADP